MFIGCAIAVYVCVSFSLLIVGGVCYYTKTSAINLNPGSCENVYISGLIMSSVVGAALVFMVIKCLADAIDFVPVKPLPKINIQVKK